MLDRGFETSSSVTISAHSNSQYLHSSDLVGLKEITYTVGWLNVEPALNNNTFRVRNYSNEDGEVMALSPGHYSFETLRRAIAEKLNTCEENFLRYDQATQTASLYLIGPSSYYSYINFGGLANMLGFNGSEWFGIKFGDTHGATKKPVARGNRRVDFRRYTALYIHLNQIDASNNWLNGKPSTLLQVVPVEDETAGQCRTVSYSNPDFRRLQAAKSSNGEEPIRQLTVRITDNEGKPINMHDNQVIMTLEIRKSVDYINGN